MRPKRLFNLAALISLVITILIASLCLFAGNAPKHFLTICNGCYLGIFGFGDGADARLAMFNNSQYGPYHGSIIGMSSPGHPLNIEIHAFGDVAGIYYRYFRWPNGAVLWTLMVSVYYPLAISLILPTAWFCANFRLRRAERRGFLVGDVHKVRDL